MNGGEEREVSEEVSNKKSGKGIDIVSVDQLERVQTHNYLLTV